MKGFAGNAVRVLMALMVLIAVLGSRGMSISAEAVELNNEPDEMLDVCFFIRGSGVGADIPEEPGSYSSSLYSSAIRVNGAVSSSKYSPSSGAIDGSEESLLSDGFTASNGVSQMLDKLPQASDIRSVVEDFDETRHYVVWYVIKSASTSSPNADVGIHVDGVIRERVNEEIEEPENPEEPEQPLEPEEPQEPVTDPIPDVTLEIRALFLEDGKECKEIEYDGREHIVGGFEIVVNDKETGNPIVGYLYECYGRFLGTKAYADSGLGTEFSYMGEEFWVNVVKAFAKVTNPGDSQEVVFYDAEDHPLKIAADFIIKDSAGNTLPAKFNVLPTTGNVSVKPRNITIEAGTTVKNNQGQTLTDGSYEITSGSLLEGHRIEKVVINGSQTGVGKSVNEITGISIVDENGKSVNHLYNITKVNGQLILVDPGTGETAVVSGGDGNSDSKTMSIVSVRKTKSGLTAVTGNVKMNNIESAGISASEAQVLGARRSDTSDPARPAGMRTVILMACLACAVFVLKNGKHSN